MNQRPLLLCHSLVVARRRNRGFTMVELMIAMLLGLIVIAGVSSVFLANLRSYRTNDALSEVQANARIAFELMARDIRQAGLTGCNSANPRIANVLNNGPWWADWGNSVKGTEGGGGGDNPDSLRVMGATGTGFAVLAHDTSGTFTLDTAPPNIDAGNIIIVCNPDHAAIVEVTGASGAKLEYAIGSKSINCTTNLSYPTSCSSSGAYKFRRNALISKMAAHEWHIDGNGAPAGSGKSLYRATLIQSGGDPKMQEQEMVRNVTNMQLKYHLRTKNTFVDADAITSQTDWDTVDAVRVTLTLQSNAQRAGTDAKPIQRDFTATITIRNRVD